MTAKSLRSKFLSNLAFAKQIPQLRRMSPWSRAILLSRPEKWINWIIDYNERVLGGGRSHELKRPVDALNEPIPWYTYSAIEYLSQIDFSKASIFEFGTGNSSLWWSERAKLVHSVESDPDWHREVSARIKPNQSLALHTDRSTYASAFLQSAIQYDMFIIDGVHRRLCVETVLKHRPPHSVVILDNSDWFPASCDRLARAGLQQIDFIGAGPVNCYAWATSIFLPHGSEVLRNRVVAGVTVRAGLTSVADDDSGDVEA
jgi:hypothetical protein